MYLGCKGLQEVLPAVCGCDGRTARIKDPGFRILARGKETVALLHLGCIPSLAPGGSITERFAYNPRSHHLGYEVTRRYRNTYRGIDHAFGSDSHKPSNR